MKKKLLLVVISLVLLVGLQACSTISTSRQESVNPGKAVMATADTTPELTIVVDESGVISFKGEGGEKIGLCRMPETKTENSALPVCNVYEKSMKVKAIGAIPIIKTEGSGCITLGPDGAGRYYQYCW